MIIANILSVDLIYKGLYGEIKQNNATYIISP